MNTIRLGARPDDFIWAAGIEDTFVPQTRAGQRPLDEYELMGHYDHWREDLNLAREVGVRALRWGVPWYRVEPKQGGFDWSWTDAVLPYLVEELGITPIIDLMHYGCPYWLTREFDNREYPRAVAAYAAAFAQRYKGLVRWYTPLNEPVVNALMCGKNGHWPPYLRGDTGYSRVILQLAQGIILTVNAIKEIDPNAVMVHVEAAGLRRSAREELAALAAEDQRRGYICYDLISGRVTPDHPLYTWLLRNGASLSDLDWLRQNAIPIDVMGLNFYPQWSTKQVHVNPKGQVAYRVVEKDGNGFITMIEDYYRHFGVPIMVTETSAFGAEKIRARWLEASLTAIRHLRESGIPVHGYTWFPLFTMVRWSYRNGKLPLEKYLLELGMYKLNRKNASPRWQATPLVEQYQGYIRNPADVIGTLNVEPQPVES